ncbi:PhoX family protein [Neptunicella sp. SCSIO 80796]|uniref:PhoX family protein n=1 Tax=Neptunicella plasticusilytica TaxID=3117012 RepID=UPI003A4D2905
MMTESKLAKTIRALIIGMPIVMLAACGDGDDGKNGVDGADGANGAAALTQVTNVPATAECPYGATLLQAGTDSNGNGVLDDTEIQSESSVCSAASASSHMIASTASIKFDSVDAPASNYDKRQIQVGQAKVVDGEDETMLDVGYHILARSGDKFGDVAFGQLVDKEGQPLFGEDGARKISDANEHTSLLPIGNKLFSVSQMESTPGAMFLMELNQDKETGELSVKNMNQIDQSGVDGGWVHCAASVTPWTTHLASEEYEPNAANPASAAGMNEYMGLVGDTNPYFYGWNIEIKVDEDASTELTKHYAMGRMAFELSYVMPDEKTVYMSDDGTNVGFFMFLADTAGDLSAGTLYAAKWNQTSADNGGAADISWINLGHATDAEISDYVHGTNDQTELTFADIFEVDGTGCTTVSTNGDTECLSIKDGMEKAASRMESRRYAALQGATTEFRKEEGITFDPDRNKLYVAKGMTDGIGDIQLAEGNSCGAVYQLNMATDAVNDNTGTAIDSSLVVKDSSVLVAGRPVSAEDPQTAGFEGNNACHIDGIASPDNVTYMSGHSQLIIGEDTGSGHQNDAIWAYDLDAGSLKRIQTTPYGAETTSPYWYPNINGWAYLMSVVQHPYGESDGDKDTGTGEARAYTGYVGPFPAKSE